MATKKSTAKPRSRTGNKNSPQLTQFKFRWWMALILVGVVAILGIVILRFSHAAVGGTGITANYRGFDGTYDRYEQIIGGYVQPAQRYSNLGNGYFVSLDGSQTRCFHITPKGTFKGTPQVIMDEVPLGTCSG